MRWRGIASTDNIRTVPIKGENCSEELRREVRQASMAGNANCRESQWEKSLAETLEQRQ